MPRATGSRNVPDETRRAATLDMIRGVHPDLVAGEYGLSRRRVYQLAEQARRDPEGRREAAREELAFWNEMCEILDAGGA